MKRLISALLVMVMACSMTAFGAQTDPKAVYDEAVRKNAELDSMDMSSKISMHVSNGQESMDTTMDMNIKMAGLSTDKFKYLATTKTETGEMTMFYVDGWYYMEMGGHKRKMKMDMDEMMSKMVANMGTTDLTSAQMSELSMREEGDRRILTFKVNGEALNSYDQLFNQYMGGLLSLSVKEIGGEVTINPEGYYTEIKMNMAIDMGMDDENVSMTADLAYINNHPGQPVEVVLPSTEGYEDLGDVGPVGTVGEIG